MTTESDWLDAFARATGAPGPSDDEREDLLALAAVAAHTAERTAAPLTCWLAARAGRTPSEALTIARDLAERLGGLDPGGR